jgi:hypothetical protein
LEEVLFHLIDGFRRYPGITVAHLYSAVVEKDYESPGADRIRRAFDGLAQRVIEQLSDKDPARIRYLLSCTLGSIIFMMLTPGFLEVDLDYSPADEARCRRLAEEYTERFLAAA